MNKKNSKRPPKYFRWDAQRSAKLEKRILDFEKRQENIPTDAVKHYVPTPSRTTIFPHVSKKFFAMMEEMKVMPIHAIHLFLETRDKALAREIKKCKIYPTDIHCKLDKSEVERMRPILCKYVFNGTPSTDEILGALFCKIEKPLSVKDVRYLAFFLEMLKEKGEICRWWQKAYIEAKVFSWKGKPVKKFSDRLRDAKNDFSSLRTEPNKLRGGQEKRLQAYQDIEETL